MNSLGNNPSEKEMWELAGDSKEAAGQSEEAKALQEAEGKLEVLEGQEASMHDLVENREQEHKAIQDE